MIRDIEAAIVERLAGVVQDIKVEAFPDRPESYNMTHPRGAVLVAFGRAVYSAPRATDIVVQDRRIEWDITLVFRDLRNHGGAYGHLDAVRMALTGWRYPGCSKMMPVREQFIDQTQGLWTFMAGFAHSIPTVEIGEDEDLPKLVKLTTEDDYGSTEVTAE